MWAQAAELVLPFTGATLMRHLTLALYPHSSPSVQTDRSSNCAVQERSQATEAQQTFPLDDSQQTHQV
jgi:hypothetical protein